MSWAFHRTVAARVGIAWRVGPDFRRACPSTLGALALGAFLIVAGCRGPQLRTLTAAEVREHGTAVFRAPRDKVLRACAEALEIMGYEVAAASVGGGVMVTKHRQARSLASWDGERAYRRSYTLEARETADHAVELAATPRLFEEKSVDASWVKLRELSAKTTWSGAEERAEWNRLFQTVAARLAAGASTGAIRR